MTKKTQIKTELQHQIYVMVYHNISSYAWHLPDQIDIIINWKQPISRQHWFHSGLLQVLKVAVFHAHKYHTLAALQGTSRLLGNTSLFFFVRSSNKVRNGYNLIPVLVVSTSCCWATSFGVGNSWFKTMIGMGLLR